MNLTYFRPKMRGNVKSTPDLLPKHQTAEICLKTSGVMLCQTFCLRFSDDVTMFTQP